MTIHEIKARSIDGTERSLREFAGKTLMIVNVASKCGFTPQYAGLQRLYERYKDRGFEILGFPSNQFAGQEPGSNEEIAEFCSLNYAVSFPLFEKIEVNGEGRHPLYEELTKQPDHKGDAGDVRWNFEKFVVSPDGEVVARFSTKLDPEAEPVVEAIEKHLPA